MKKFLLVVSGLAASLATPALAKGTNLVIHSEGAKGTCIDAHVQKNEEGTPVYVYKCHGRDNQRWAVTDDENAQSAVIGFHGLCLDIRGNGKGDGAPTQLWKCHFGANQRFTVEKDGHIKEAASGKCLAAKGDKDMSPIILDDCKAEAHQLWKLADK